MSQRPLFRQEVINHQSNKDIGDIILLPDTKTSVLVYCLSALFFTIFLFLLLGNYNAKQRVVGVIVPDQGIIKVFPTSNGIFKEIYIEDGQWVEKGEPLALISFESILASGDNINQLQENRLREVENNLQKVIHSAPEKQKIQQESLLNLQSSLQKEKILLQEQIELTQQRLSIFRDRQSRLTQLYKQGLISMHVHQEGQDQYLQIQQALSQQNEQMARVTTEHKNIGLQLQNTDFESQVYLGQLQNELAQIEKLRTEAQFLGEQLIRAPMAGYVTALQTQIGHQALAAKPLLTLLPRQSNFEAHLFVPSRAIGQIHEGQEVLLQFEAFPFQRYGTYKGHISRMSRTILNSDEIQNFSFSAAHEPVYLLTVSLEKQHVEAYGRQLPLQVGMVLQAEIVLDKRRLWEWLLEPLYAIGGS